MSELPHVSVIIPVHNDSQRLRLCLEALCGQSYPGERTQIIVVDNLSDESLERVRTEYPNVEFLLETKPGSYAARNKGIAAALGQVIAFTDSDCIPAYDWLERGVSALTESPDCGLIGGRIEIIFKSPNRPTAVELYESLWAFPQHDFIGHSKFGATANVFTRREVLQTVGPFDASLKSGGDREWGNRVHKHGYKLFYRADVRVLHPARSSFAEIRRKMKRVEQGIVQVEVKNGYSPLRFLKDLLNYNAGILLRIGRTLRGPSAIPFFARLKAVSVLAYVALFRSWCRSCAYVQCVLHCNKIIERTT